MLSQRACALLIPFSLTLACAGTTAPAADRPQCESEPSITVADPASPGPQLTPRFTNELIDLRLFVVTQAQDEGEALPDSIRNSTQCQATGCSLVISPRLLGRNNDEMRLEIGEGVGDDVFVLEAQPRAIDGQIDLHLSARLLPEGASPHQTQRFRFSGVLEEGRITHVGTFYSEGHSDHSVGPQVFAVAEYATPESR